MKSAQLHIMCGLTLGSNVPLRELPKTNIGPADCIFHLDSPAKPHAATTGWFHRWRTPGGRVWLSLARHGSDYLLRFPKLGDFLVSGDAKLIHCYPFPEVPVDTIRHLLLDQVMPVVLSRRQRLVLHASAVTGRDRGIAFLGAAGQGKSTLALSFCKQGFSLLTDDCLLLSEKSENPIAIPSYSGVRLWPDGVSALCDRKPLASRVAHYSKKKRLGHNGWPPFCAEPARLTHMYFLARSRKRSERAQSVTISPLSAQEAFIELTRFAYLLDIGDQEMLRQSFDRISRLAVGRFFYRLAYPRKYSLLPVVQEAVLQHLRSGT